MDFDAYSIFDFHPYCGLGSPTLHRFRHNEIFTRRTFKGAHFERTMCFSCRAYAELYHTF